MIGVLVVLLLVSCRGGGVSTLGDDVTNHDAGGVDVGARDPDAADSDPQIDASIDAAPDAGEREALVLYPEGARHSPITPAIAARLRAIAGSAATQANVFAKVGDSITVDTDFMACFDGGAVDFGGRADMASLVSYFMSGSAAGASPFARVSLAAKGGTTARDAVTGSPSPFDRELTALAPQIAVVMFGTNEARYGWTLDEFATYLWDLIDLSIARGVVPIMSTIPASTGYPEANTRIPTFNRLIRVIAQGRGVPLVDLHRELAGLPDRGISSDGLHPSSAPSGGCDLSSSGLQYGYNVRNLISLEALARLRAALTGSALDGSAAVRQGGGRESDPYLAGLPLVDLGDTRASEPHVDHGCGASSGHQVTYRLSIPGATTIDAYVADRPGTDVDLRILLGGVCVAVGGASASVTVPGGPVDVVVDARSQATEGEFLLVVQSR